MTPTTLTTDHEEARMGYTADLPGAAPGRPDLRTTRSQTEIRAEAEAQRRRRRLQAYKGENTRSLMRAPQGR